MSMRIVWLLWMLWIVVDCATDTSGDVTVIAYVISYVSQLLAVCVRGAWRPEGGKRSSVWGVYPASGPMITYVSFM